MTLFSRVVLAPPHTPPLLHAPPHPIPNQPNCPKTTVKMFYFTLRPHKLISIDSISPCFQRSLHFSTFTPEVALLRYWLHNKATLPYLHFVRTDIT